MLFLVLVSVTRAWYYEALICNGKSLSVDLGKNVINDNYALHIGDCQVTVGAPNFVINLDDCDVDSGHVVTKLCQKIGTVWIELDERLVKCTDGNTQASAYQSNIVARSGQ